MASMIANVHVELSLPTAVAAIVLIEELSDVQGYCENPAERLAAINKVAKEAKRKLKVSTKPEGKP